LLSDKNLKAQLPTAINLKMKDKLQLFKAQTETNFQQFTQLKTTKQISLKKQQIDQLKKALKSTQGSHSTN
jgi:hypothetical protein